MRVSEVIGGQNSTVQSRNGFEMEFLFNPNFEIQVFLLFFWDFHHRIFRKIPYDLDHFMWERMVLISAFTEDNREKRKTAYKAIKP